MATKQTVAYIRSIWIPVSRTCKTCGESCSEKIHWEEQSSFNRGPFTPARIELLQFKLLGKIEVSAYCKSCKAFSPEFQKTYFSRGSRQFLKGWPPIILAISQAITIFLIGYFIYSQIDHHLSKRIATGLMAISIVVLPVKYFDRRKFQRRVDSLPDHVVEEILVKEYSILKNKRFKNGRRKHKYCKGWEARNKELLMAKHSQ